jgi:hypothetical protein
MGEEVAPSVLIFLVPSHPKHNQVHGPIGELGRMTPRYFLSVTQPPKHEACWDNFIRTNFWLLLFFRKFFQLYRRDKVVFEKYSLTIYFLFVRILLSRTLNLPICVCWGQMSFALKAIRFFSLHSPPCISLAKGNYNSKYGGEYGRLI